MAPPIFRLSCSELGSLLGAFGGISQYNAILKVWRKSTLTNKIPKEAAITSSDSRGSFLARYNITKQWDKLQNDMRKCANIESIQELEQQSFDLLFNSEHMKKQLEGVITKLSEQKIAKHIQKRFTNLISDFIPSADGYDICYKLKELKEHNGLDSLKHIIIDLENATKFYHQSQGTVACAYGRNCETTSIEAFNNVHETPITPYGKLHREFVHESDEYKWSIEGYIDGKINDDIIEIKHRKLNIKDNIPVYDKLQVHGYMVLHNVCNSYMLQCIQRQDILYQQRTCIPFDDRLWDTLVCEVNIIIDFIISLATNPLTKDCFFKLPIAERENIISNYIKSTLFNESTRKRKRHS
jgi:hypothetical protein